VSIDDLSCHLCIGCSLSLINKGTKLCVITDIFGTSYFLTGTSSVLTRQYLHRGVTYQSDGKDLAEVLN
jgi:hypothetical protein